MQELEEEIALLDERAIEFSKLYPEKTFVYIDVDCFGGTCSYDGFTVKNGNTIFIQKPIQDGHRTLLKSIFPKYENVYFEPFTRDFFARKGRIEGVIQDFSLGGLFVGFDSEYKDKALYKISASSDFLLFERLEHYYFLFESDEQSDDIKISGIIYKDEKEVLQEIEEFIQETFFILTYTIFVSIDGVLEPKRFENKVESPKQKRKFFWQRLID
ncbi:hypothetical protein [Leptospira tipperaryensis]|nr:hypothetical protein [Leptospira tipperaryensis]